MSISSTSSAIVEARVTFPLWDLFTHLEVVRDTKQTTDPAARKYRCCVVGSLKTYCVAIAHETLKDKTLKACLSGVTRVEKPVGLSSIVFYKGIITVNTGMRNPDDSDEFLSLSAMGACLHDNLTRMGVDVSGTNSEQAGYITTNGNSLSFPVTFYLQRKANARDPHEKPRLKCTVRQGDRIITDPDELVGDYIADVTFTPAIVVKNTNLYINFVAYQVVIQGMATVQRNYAPPAAAVFEDD